MGLLDRLRRDDPRVVVLGIDGVPYTLIDDHPEVFPNLHRIRDRGTGSAISSIVPPESSACWPVLTTGVNPGKTGVYGFQDRRQGSYETYIPMGDHVQARRVWSYVTESGRHASVFNVPVTFPPDEQLQRMVTGFLSPDVDAATHPASLRDSLKEHGYRIDVDAKLGHDEDKTAFIDDAMEVLKRRFEVFETYLRRDDWDLFFGVFMTTDRVNHFLFDAYERDGHYRDTFLEFYATLDDYLGRLSDTLGEDTTLLVVSDHGFTTLDYEVHVNRWLEDHGWLSFADGDPEGLEDISDETTAYSLIPGRFYINLEGREPRGGVPAAELNSVKSTLREQLTELEGPDGRPVCRDIVDGADVFTGAFTEIAPDLVVLPNDGYDLKAGFSDGGPVFDTGPRTGMHTFDNATLISDAPSIDASRADLLDITPTILDLMSIEYDPSDFDGRTLNVG